MDPVAPIQASSDHFYIVVSGIVALLLALIPLIFNSIRTAKKVRSVEYQVKNNHSTNLREEQDERHHENRELGVDNSKKLDRIITALSLTQGSVLTIQSDVGELKERVANLDANALHHDEQIEELERTIDRRPRPGKHGV